MVMGTDQLSLLEFIMEHPQAAPRLKRAARPLFRRDALQTLHVQSGRKDGREHGQS